MPDCDVAVVGAGLFGNIIAAALRQQKRTVIVVDDARLGSGSRPAACLMKPSWFSGMGPGVYKPALALLDELYGLHEIPFRVLRGHVNVHWCDPRKILQPADKAGRVRTVRRNGDGWVLHLEDEVLEARTAVLAAGIWTPALVFDLEVRGYAGAAYLWEKEHLDDPFIRVWAPYRQLVAFNRGDGVWVGDGSAVDPQRWAGKNEDASRERCARAVGYAGTPTVLYGVRPYVKGAGPCLLREVRPGLWAATGGAKNGTVAAAWCAYEICRKT